MFDEIVGKVERLMKVILLAMVTILIAVASVRIATAESYTCVVHKGEWVWIRETPSADGRKIGRMRFGYEVDTSEIVNGFLAIDIRKGWLLDGETAGRGYVDRSYFDMPIKETMYRVNTNAGPLAKRETPEGRLMCWIKAGSKISVLGWRYSKSGELWAKVFKGGYVKAEYLADL